MVEAAHLSITSRFSFQIFLNRCAPS